MTGKKPRELLSNRELIGFKRTLLGGRQVARRASSAKVTKPVDSAESKTQDAIPTRKGLNSAG